MQDKRFACNNLLIKVVDQYVKAIVHKCLTFLRYVPLCLPLFGSSAGESLKCCIGRICERGKMQSTLE